MTGAALSFSDLTIPDSGPGSVRELLSLYLDRQLRDFLALRVRGRGPSQQALALLQRHCRALAKTDPAALLRAVQHTTIGGLIRFLCDGAADSEHAPLWAGRLAAMLYAELAMAGAAPEPVLLSPLPPRLLLAGAGAAFRFPDDATTARLHPRGITVVTSSGATIVSWEDIASGASAFVSSAQLSLRGRTRFALVDDSPLADFETHPDKTGNRLDLGGRPVEEWTASLAQALDVVGSATPAIADEIELLIDQLVPVGFDAERHLSASYREMVGTIYLSLHPEILTLAEALVHEHSHNKLNMLWTLQPMLHNGFDPLYASPFRPDPRPLHGLLLGVHAFLAIERLHEQLAAGGHPSVRVAGFERRRAMVREHNAAACEMLSMHAQPTASGAPVLEEILRWNAHFS